ncbi:MAG: saccharopine dehydrogenase family protein [Acidobacteriota bacterium]
MKILVFGGSGKIGSAVAWDLVGDPNVEEVGLVGRRREALEEVKAWIGSEKLTTQVVDVEDRARMKKLMKRYDAGALALPDRRTSYRTVELAVTSGLSIVDMLEEYHRRPDPYEVEGLEHPAGMSLDAYGDWLHEQAIANGVTFLDGMGFAPGLSNITLGDGIRQLDTAEVATARVGGIPAKDAAGRHPLRYMITWAFEHVLREYMVRLQVKKGGQVIEVDAGSDRESFRFCHFGRDEELECAVTPGMPSFIHSRPQLREFAEKTVRWPGHWQGVRTLKECGLLDLEPVEVNGTSVVPREFLLALITPRLRALPGDTDVCVMYNTLLGTRAGQRVTIEYFMWDEADTAHGLSSMMRATGFPVAIAVRMVAAGRIAAKGIVPPEDGIAGPLYHEFMGELAKRKITVQEVVTQLG